MNEERLPLINRVPTPDRPADWDDTPLDERLFWAVRYGYVD